MDKIIENINKYRSVTRFRDFLAGYIFANYQRIRTTLMMNNKFVCSNPECFVHNGYTQQDRFFIFNINIKFDFFPRTFLKLYFRTNLRIAYNRFFKSLRSCSTDDANCMAG